MSSAGHSVQLKLICALLSLVISKQLHRSYIFSYISNEEAWGDVAEAKLRETSRERNLEAQKGTSLLIYATL